MLMKTWTFVLGSQLCVMSHTSVAAYSLFRLARRWWSSYNTLLQLYATAHSLALSTTSWMVLRWLFILWLAHAVIQHFFGG